MHAHVSPHLGQHMLISQHYRGQNTFCVAGHERRLHQAVVSVGGGGGAAAASSIPFWPFGGSGSNWPFGSSAAATSSAAGSSPGGSGGSAASAAASGTDPYRIFPPLKQRMSARVVCMITARLLASGHTCKTLVALVRPRFRKRVSWLSRVLHVYMIISRCHSSGQDVSCMISKLVQMLYVCGNDHL